MRFCFVFDVHDIGQNLQALANAPCSRASDRCRLWHRFRQAIPSSINKRGELCGPSLMGMPVFASARVHHDFVPTFLFC